MVEDWVLSKESMKVFDLLKASADILFALEQLSQKGKEHMLSEAEIKKKLRIGRNLLDKIILALEKRTTYPKKADPFILRLVIEIRHDTKLTKARLLKLTLEAKSELMRHQISEQTAELLNTIYNSLMNLSRKRIEALSLSFC
jgi:hypothetical protein